MTGKILAAAIAVAFAGGASAADAQIRMPRLPVIVPLGGNAQPQPPMAAPAMPGISQGHFVASSGSDTVYFSARGTNLDSNAIATLTAQARWLLANPYVSVRLEGHGDARDTRDYAIAIGDKRANAVRDVLIMQGVLPHRITMLSWGKERPGTIRVGPSFVAAGPRVTTIIR